MTHPARFHGSPPSLSPHGPPRRAVLAGNAAEPRAPAHRPWRHTLDEPPRDGPRFRSAYQVLRALAAFAPVSDGELLKFAALGCERRVERGQCLAPGAGRLEPPLTLVMEGEALRVWEGGADEVFVRALEPGDLVDECAAFERPETASGAGEGHANAGGGVERGSAGAFARARGGGSVREPAPDYEAWCDEATTRAATTVRLMEWDRDAVRETLRRWPDVALCLLTIMARRQRALERRVTGLCLQPAPRRLARALTALLEERGTVWRDGAGRPGALLARTPSRTRLAGIAGMARETVSRLLADWKRRGWVTGLGNDLLILDRQQLRRLAGGRA